MPDSDELQIRESAPDDFGSLKTLYRDAFPDEDLLPLVSALLETPDTLSLAATIASSVVGHIIFTPCRVAGHPEKVALLGPLAVAPDRQRRGIGSALIRAGLERLEPAGMTCVFVLGDPGYYGPLGFAPETDVAPPYPLPEEWRNGWQSIRVTETPLQGPLQVPAPWRRQALWAP